MVEEEKEEDEEEEDLGDNGYSYEFYDGGDDVVSDPETKRLPRPCELYVCNLPRSYDIPELAQMFKPFGTVFSIEVLFLSLSLLSFYLFLIQG